MADTMTIEERLNLLFPGITKSSYSMRDVLPRRPRGVTPTQERTAQRMFAGYTFDPRVGRNVPGDPYQMMDQLNQLATQRGAARMELEEQETKKAGLRTALESVYGAGALEGIEGGPESMWASLAGVRSRRMEAERAAGLDAEDARRRAKMYRDMVVKRFPWMAEHLPQEGLGESDIMRIFSFQQGAREEEEQKRRQGALTWASQQAQERFAAGDLAGGRRVLEAAAPSVFKGPQALQWAMDTEARLVEEAKAQQEAEQKAGEERQQQYEKGVQGAEKFAGSLAPIVSKVRALAIQEPKGIKPGTDPEHPLGMKMAPGEVNAMARELGNLLQEARSLAERAGVGGDLLQQVLSDVLGQAGGGGPTEGQRGSIFDALILGETPPALPAGMSWGQATGAEPFGDMQYGDVKRAARLIADALDQFASQYMTYYRSGR